MGDTEEDDGDEELHEEEEQRDLSRVQDPFIAAETSLVRTCLELDE